MGRESTSYFLTISPEIEEAVILALREGGAQLAGSGHTWVELRVRDPHRYWIDLRVHRGPEPLLEIRIALTNDEWSIRAPLEEAFTALPPAAARHPLRDEDGAALGAPGEAGWSLRLEENYGIRRADFVERVGDFTAPLSADHVYMYIHQTGRAARRRRRAGMATRARDQPDRADVGGRAAAARRPPGPAGRSGRSRYAAGEVRHPRCDPARAPRAWWIDAAGRERSGAATRPRRAAACARAARRAASPW